MKSWLIVLAALVVALLAFLLTPHLTKAPTLPIVEAKDIEAVEEAPELAPLIQAYLQAKDSPLAPEIETLLKQKHWKLLIAISAIESQYCKRQLGFNCWGIGGDNAYRQYSSVREAIVDANDLIERWQQRGRWHTVEDMNCHYVVPCNPNWVYVVTNVLKKMDDLERFIAKNSERAEQYEIIISIMLNDDEGRYAYASDTLTDILEYIERNNNITDGQVRAVENIKEKPSNGY